ncbi:hypothetical protein [Streptomyces sp. NPDC051657]
MNHRAAAASWLELEALHSWMSEARGELTFVQLANRSVEAGHPVSERTLRRAFGMRLPQEETIRAYAGAWARWTSAKNPEVDEAGQALRRAFETRGLELLAAAVSTAPEHPVPLWPPPVYLPGPISTWPALTKGLKRLYKETDSPPLRRLVASPRAGGRLSKSTIGNVLNGKHPTLEQLTALLGPSAHRARRPAGCSPHTGGSTPSPSRPPSTPATSSNGPRTSERHSTRRRRRGAGTAASRPSRNYDQQLRDEEEAKRRQLEVWVDSLSDEELAAQNQAAAVPGRDLRSELNDVRNRLGKAPGPPQTA